MLNCVVHVSDVLGAVAEKRSHIPYVQELNSHSCPARLHW